MLEISSSNNLWLVQTVLFLINPKTDFYKVFIKKIVIDNDFPMWNEREDEEIWLTSHDNGDRSIGERKKIID
jgi:hypothetical protein